MVCESGASFCVAKEEAWRLGEVAPLEEGERWRAPDPGRVGVAVPSSLWGVPGSLLTDGKSSEVRMGPIVATATAHSSDDGDMEMRRERRVLSELSESRGAVTSGSQSSLLKEPGGTMLVGDAIIGASLEAEEEGGRKPAAPLATVISPLTAAVVVIFVCERSAKDCVRAVRMRLTTASRISWPVIPN